MLQVLQTIFTIFLCFVLSGFNPQGFKAVMEERKELASPTMDESVRGMLKGTFIQSWLSVALKEADWDTELGKMKALGMEYLVFQTELSGGTLYNTDPAVENDTLSIVLKYAKKHGIKLIVGLTDGSTLYYAWPDAFTTALTPWRVPFAEFHEKDLAEAEKMMREILEKYGEAYDEQIYGWYFAHEFFNNPLYGQAAWKSIGKQLNGYVQKIENSSAPNKPLILSPYYLIGTPYVRPNNFVSGLRTLFAEAKFRPFDVFMPQDGFGTDSQQLPVDIVVPSLLTPWIQAMSQVAAEYDVRFWINNEAFMTANIETRPPEQLVQMVRATDEYTDTHFIFSWNHYYSATFYKDKADLEQRFADIFAPN